MTNRLIAYVFAINQAYEYIRNIVALKKYDLHIKGGRIQGSEKSHPQLGKYEENAYFSPNHIFQILHNLSTFLRNLSINITSPIWGYLLQWE